MSKLLNLKTMLLGMLLLSAVACKSPTNDVKVVVDMNIMKYSALMRISDTKGATPQNVSLSISGTSANDIYEISGKKVFTVKDGVITLGLNPSVTPTNADVNYSVVISAPGYKTLTQPMSFKNGVNQQIIAVTLQKSTDDSAPIVATPVPVTPAPVSTPTSPGAPAVTMVTLDFTGHCANRTNLQIRPSLYVFYRAKGATAYQYLGYMTDGHMETTALTVGNSYDFQITYAGENYNVSGVVDKTSYQETFSMGNSICNTF